MHFNYCEETETVMSIEEKITYVRTACTLNHGILYRFNRFDSKDYNGVLWADYPTTKKRVHVGDLECLTVVDLDYGSYLFQPIHFSCGDYCGSLVEKSNRIKFLEQFGLIDGVYELSADFGYSGVVFNISALNTEMIELLDSISECGQIDDEQYDELVRESEDTAWNDYSIKRDFINAIENKFDLLIDEDQNSDDVIRKLFEDVRGRVNQYWINEQSNTSWIDIYPIVASVTYDDLIEYLSGIQLVIVEG
jgi:hypothetical protein